MATAEELKKESEKKNKKKSGLPALAAFNVKMPEVLRKPYAQECVDREMSANALTVFVIEKYLKDNKKIPKELVVEIPKSGGRRLAEKIAEKDKTIAELQAQIEALKAGKK